MLASHALAYLTTIKSGTYKIRTYTTRQVFNFDFVSTFFSWLSLRWELGFIMLVQSWKFS